MLVGPEAQPSSRPPWLGGGPPVVTPSAAPPLAVPPSRSRSLDVFESRATAEDMGSRPGVCAIAWMGDASSSVAPPAPTRPRSAAPSPRRAPSPRCSSSPRADSSSGCNALLDTSDTQLETRPSSDVSCLSEGPPGKLPLGHRLRQQSQSGDLHTHSMLAAGSPRMAACSLSAASQRRPSYGGAGANTVDHHPSSCAHEASLGFYAHGREVPLATQATPANDHLQKSLAMAMSSPHGSSGACASGSCAFYNGASAAGNSSSAVVSAEQAALAAGALAELRASVALLVGRLDSLEVELADDTRQRQELSRAFAQYKKKQAEALNQVFAISGTGEKMSAQLEKSISDWNERFSGKLDQSTAEWRAKQTHVDSQILCLEQSCRFSQDSCKDLFTQFGALREERAQQMMRLEESVSQWRTWHHSVDSRITGLEQSCGELQVQVRDSSAKTEASLQQLPMQSEIADEIKMRMGCLEEKLEQQENSLQAEIGDEIRMHMGRLEEKLEQQTFFLQADIVDRTSQLENARASLAGIVGDADSRIANLEAFNKSLAENPPWEQLAEQTLRLQQPRMPETVPTWEVEQHFRSIAEEVCAVVEQSMAMYVDAARAELLQRIENTTQQCGAFSSNADEPEFQDSMELSVSCPEPYSSEAIVNALIQPGLATRQEMDTVACSAHPKEVCEGLAGDANFVFETRIDDATPSALALPPREPEGLARNSRSDRASGKPKCEDPMPANERRYQESPSQHGLQSRSQSLQMARPSSAGSVASQQCAGSASQRTHASVSSADKPDKAAIASSVSTVGLPVWRPSGAAPQVLLSSAAPNTTGNPGNRRCQPASGTVRRFRSASPVQAREGAMPVERVPNARSCSQELTK